MHISNIHEAKTQLSRLIEQAEQGEEVIIAKAGRPVVKLVPYQTNEKPRHGGQWRGKVHMAKDFDTLPNDIAAAFGLISEQSRQSKQSISNKKRAK